MRWPGPSWAALNRLFRRYWFCRVWVVQEVVVGEEEPVFFLGDRAATWKSMTFVAVRLFQEGLVRCLSMITIIQEGVKHLQRGWGFLQKWTWLVGSNTAADPGSFRRFWWDSTTSTLQIIGIRFMHYWVSPLIRMTQHWPRSTVLMWKTFTSTPRGTCCFE
jgi:hypothetical protein